MTSFVQEVFDPRLTLEIIEGLDGYVLAGPSVVREMRPPTNDRLDGMFLQIPQVHGRDLVDLIVEARDGEEWLRHGSTLYRPLGSVAALAVGATAVTIGAEGFAEWRALPAPGKVTIANATAWRLYDAGFVQTASGVGDGEAVLPSAGAAAYLVLSATPGDVIDVTVAP